MKNIHEIIVWEQKCIDKDQRETYFVKLSKPTDNELRKVATFWVKVKSWSVLPRKTEREREILMVPLKKHIMKQCQGITQCQNELRASDTHHCSHPVNQQHPITGHQEVHYGLMLLPSRFSKAFLSVTFVVPDKTTTSHHTHSCTEVADWLIDGQRCLGEYYCNLFNHNN